MRGATEERLRVAIELARAAGDLTLAYFRRRVEVETKKDGSPVTVADRGAEALIRERLAARFPRDGVLGEEFGHTPGTSGFEWILDPMDGTISFVRGVPLYGTLIGVTHAGEPGGGGGSSAAGTVAGVIHMPALDEMVYAHRGGGCWHAVGGGEPARCRASGAASLGDALVAMTDPNLFARHRPGSFGALGGACRAMRGWSDCYAHLLVATGRADAAVEPIVSVWDVAPMPVIMEEAGGVFFDWTGGGRIDAGHAASCAPGIAGALRGLLGPFAG
mgnify:CR=1 FL=1